MAKDKFYQLSYELAATKTFNPTQKLLIASMLADQEMNGHIKWSKSQYAEKIAATRDFVLKFFKYSEFYGLISEGMQKKKYGTYYKLDIDQLNRLIALNNKEIWKTVVSNYISDSKQKKSQTTEKKFETTPKKFETTEKKFETTKKKFETTHIDTNRNLIEKEIDTKYEKTDLGSSLERTTSSFSGEDSNKVILDDEHELDQFLKELDI